MSLQTTLEKAGFKFKAPRDGYDFSALRGKSCFGSMLTDPNVFSMADLKRVAKDMTPIVKRKMAFLDNSGGWTESARDVALVNEIDGSHVNTVTNAYNLVQDRDLVMEAADAVQELGLTPVGSVRQTNNRLHATLIMADPEFEIELLKDHGRSIAAGFSFTNSYTSDLGIHTQASGIDTFCINYNPWGKIVAERSLTHLDSGDLTDKVREVLESCLKEAPRVQRLYDVAHEVQIVPRDVAPILAGAGFTSTQTEFMDKMRTALEPETKSRLTAMTLNMAATAYATHVANTTPGSLRELSSKAMMILTNGQGIDKLRESGREIVKAWDEQARKTKDKAEARKASKLQATQ